MKVGSLSTNLGIKEFKPSILGKFNGRKIVLSSNPLRIKDSDMVKQENRSLCSRLIKTAKARKLLA